jgi:hypothetical protein
MIQALLYFGVAVTGDLANCVLAAWPGDIECAVGQDPWLQLPPGLAAQ